MIDYEKKIHQIISLANCQTEHPPTQICQTMPMVDKHKSSDASVDVTLKRVSGGRLGFKIRTVPAKHRKHGEDETVTLAYGMVTPLPNDSLSSAKLWNDDRIISVNGHSITQLPQAEVAKLLKDLNHSRVTLTILPRFGDRYNYVSKSGFFGCGGSHRSDSNDHSVQDDLESLPILSSNITPVKRYTDYAEFPPNSSMQSPLNFSPQVLNERAIFHSSPSVATQEYISLQSLNDTTTNSSCRNLSNGKGVRTPAGSQLITPDSATTAPPHAKYSTSVDNVADAKTGTRVAKSLFKSPFRSHSDNTLLIKKKAPHRRENLSKDSIDTPSPTRQSPLFCEKCGRRVNLCDCFHYNLSTPEREVSAEMLRSQTPVNKIISDIFDKKKVGEYSRGRCRRHEVGNDCRCLSCMRALVDRQHDVLKKPHMVRWLPETKVVSLERSKRDALGFSFKVKIGKNRDGSPEVYTLVDQVKKGSIAEGRLFVGDWMRSVNGKPLYTTKEALNLNRYVEKNGTLRFIIQRPESFRDDPVSPQKPNNSHHGKFHSPSGSSATNLEKSKSAGALSSFKPSNDMKLVDLKPVQSQPDAASLDLADVVTNLDNITVSDKKSSTPSQNLSNVSLRAASSYTSAHSTTSPGIHMMYIRNNPAVLDERVGCPWRQVFVVGNQAVTLAQIMFPEMRDAIFAAWMDKNRKFIHFKSAVQLDEEGAMNVVDFNSSKDGVSLPVLLSQWFCSHTEISADDVLLSVEQSLGEPSIKFTPWVHTKTVGLDVFVVLDDDFFTTCCHPLFSYASVFFVAFDACRLLAKNDDLSLISDAIYTARCFADQHVAINLYGVLESRVTDPVTNMIDELRALLYTDKGKPIFQHRNVNMPAFIVTHQASQKASRNDTYMLQTNLCQNVFHGCGLHERFRVATLLVWAQVVKMRRRGQYIVTVGNLVHCIKENVIDLNEEQATAVVKEMADCGSLLLACDKRTLTSTARLQSTDFLLTDLPYALDCIQSLVTSLEKNHHSVGGKSRRHKMASVSGREIDRALSAGDKDTNIWTSILKNLDVIFQLYQCDDLFIVPYFSENNAVPPPPVLTEISDIIELVFNDCVTFTAFLKLVLALSWTYHHAEVVLDSLSHCSVTNDELTIRMELISSRCLVRITTLPKFSAELPKSFQVNLNEAYRDVFQNSSLYVRETLVNGVAINSKTRSGGDSYVINRKIESNGAVISEKSHENGVAGPSSANKQVYSVYM